LKTDRARNCDHYRGRQHMSPILTEHLDHVDFESLDYSAVTTSGDACARIAKVCSAGVDGRLSTVGVWTCMPCTFGSNLVTDETILVLEGEARIELDDGTAVDLQVGDIAVLPRGHTATWTVKTPFKEFFVLSDAAAPVRRGSSS
jgi:uncharacterized cupin superfamily protein